MNAAADRVSSGVEAYVRQVGKGLRDLSAEQRAEIEGDLAERLRDRGVQTHADAVAAFGEQASYITELRAAMELPPLSSVRRRRLLRMVAVAATLLLAAAGIWYAQRDDEVPTNYPLVFGNFGVLGAGSSAGSTVLMPTRLGEEITISVVVWNNGERTVRLDAVGEVNGASGDQAVLSIGPELPPLWVPAVKVFPQEDAFNTVVVDFDDPTGLTLPVTLDPGDAVMLSLRGQRAYCVDNDGAITEHITLETTIDGASRTFEGNELSFDFADCS